MALQNIIQKRAALVEADKDARKAFELHCEAYKRAMKDLAEREAMIVGGLDLDKIDAGRAVITIQGDASSVCHANDMTRAGVRTKAVEDAKRQIADGGIAMSRRYIGVKNYSGFGDQREDHEYGYGPKHGHIVFGIRLTEDIRQRLKDGGAMTPEEIDAALYVLSALPKIEGARKTAA